MQQKFLGLLLFIFLFCVIPVEASEPVIGASAAIVIDATTGEVLYEKNAYELLAPASTTKVLTALLALATTDVDCNCIVSYEASLVGESSIYLREGEEFTLSNLLAAALIKSANDSCFAIAENVAGSESLFVQLMNQKAGFIGAYYLNVNNTNGLPDDEHVMSAYALAQIARNALSYDLFREYIGTQSYIIEGGEYTRVISTTNSLLAMGEEYFGIKTGTTDAAGSCLIGGMTYGDREIISVVLHSPDRYNETVALLNYGAENFINHTYANTGEVMAILPVQYGVVEQVAAVVGGVAVATLAIDEAENCTSEVVIFENLVAPISEGEILGAVVLRDEAGEIIAQTPLVAATNIEKKEGFSLFLAKLIEKF